MNQVLDWLISSVQSVDPGLRNLAAGFAIMLETSIFIGLIVPGDTVVLVASTGVLDFGDYLWLLLAVLVGSMLGETIGFGIGRLFGRRIRNSRLGRRIGEKNWQLADSFVETRGGIAVAISRFIPILHSVVPVTAGMTKMRYRTFMLWTFGACVVWTSAYVSVGYFARESYQQLAAELKWAGAVFVALILLFVVGMHFLKKRLELTARRMAAEGEAARAAVAGGTQLSGPEGFGEPPRESDRES